MTSSPILITSKPSFSWSAPERIVPLIVFLVLLVHGSLLGLTDDEAYYWVLAQKPSLAYAFHPPAVAWMIGIAQGLFGWLVGIHQPGLVRLPAAFCAAMIVGLGLEWMKAAGASQRGLWKGALILLSFSGFFSLAWMMVPDLPLFLGWTLAFYATWKICSGDSSLRSMALLTLGMSLSILSKYSGVLVGGSAFLCLLFWGAQDRKWRAIAYLVLGAFAGVLPSLIWNATHDWDSLLYQVRDRHGGGSLSLIRYLRFWAVEIVAAGPVLITFLFTIFKKALGKSGASPERRRSDQEAQHVFRFVSIWVLPALLIFCVQPLWADFKPHWAFIVWWPVALGMGWFWSRGNGLGRGARFQIAFGGVLGSLVLLSCHFPLGGWAMALLARNPSEVNPKLDVTNDLYGWNELPAFIQEKAGIEALALPVLGSRYQTASQAAFAVGGAGMKATLLPRDAKSRDEWPDLPVADGWGPHWPRLTQAVLFVADNRYDAGPSYPGASCEKLGRLQKNRVGFPAKWIDVWKCHPTR